MRITKKSGLGDRVRQFCCVLLAASALFMLDAGAWQPVVHADEAQPDAEDAVRRVYAPLIAGPGLCQARLAPSLFGLQLYGDTSSNVGYFDQYKATGARWVRAPLPWVSVEKTNSSPAAFNWSYADKVVGAASDACLNMVLTHVNAPTWAATAPDGPIDKVSLSELAQYMGAVVERYDGDGFMDAPGSPKVEYFEMYNEPDEGAVPGGGRWGDDGDKYAEMLKVVYPAVKAASPNAKVVFGGIAYEWFREVEGGPFVKAFLTDVLDAGGGNYFDVMNFHAYPIFAGVWADRGPGLYEKTKEVRKVLKKYGFGDKDIIITETGWHSDNSDPIPYGSPEYQARFLPQLYTQSLAANVKFATWFSMIDLDDYPYDTGLISSGSPASFKPAYSVYQAAVNQLSPLIYERQLDEEETKLDDLTVYKFRNDAARKDVYVGWLNPVDTQGSALLQLAGETATVYDMFGASAVVEDTSDGKNDGQLSFQIGGRTVYIHISK